MHLARLPDGSRCDYAGAPPASAAAPQSRTVFDVATRDSGGGDGDGHGTNTDARGAMHSCEWLDHPDQNCRN